MFANLLLDWSGTLVDDFHPTLLATNEVFAKFGVPAMEEAEFRERFRLPYPEFYKEVLPNERLEDLEEVFKEAFLRAEQLVKPLAPTRRFLAQAEKLGVRLFVLSSMNEEAFERQALDFGLLAYFEKTYAGVLDKRTEIGKILEAHGLEPSATAFIGDMTHDVDAALHGGVTSVAVLSGYDPPARLAAHQPGLILSDVGGLLPLLDGQVQRSLREDIRIQKLRVPTQIGVTAEERAESQELKISVTMETRRGIGQLGDRIESTVDYFEVSEQIKKLAGKGERALIETLAEDVADLILSDFDVRAVKVLIEKPILVNCEAVSVEILKSSRV